MFSKDFVHPFIAIYDLQYNLIIIKVQKPSTRKKELDLFVINRIITIDNGKFKMLKTIEISKNLQMNSL